MRPDSHLRQHGVRYPAPPHPWFSYYPKGTTELDRKAIGVAYKYKSNIKRWGHTKGNDKRSQVKDVFVTIVYETIRINRLEMPFR